MRDGNRVAGYWRELAPDVERWTGGRPGVPFHGTWFPGKEFTFAADDPVFDPAGKVEWRALWYPEDNRGFYWFHSHLGPFHGDVTEKLYEDGIMEPPPKRRGQPLLLSGIGNRWSQDPGSDTGGGDVIYRAEFTPKLRNYVNSFPDDSPAEKEERKARVLEQIRAMIRRMKIDRETVEILRGLKASTFVDPYTRNGRLVEGYWRELQPDSEVWRGPLFKGTWFGFDSDFIYADNDPFFIDRKLYWKALYYPDTDRMKMWIPSTVGPHHTEVLTRAYREHRRDVTEEESYKIAGFGNEWNEDAQSEDIKAVDDFSRRWAHRKLWDKYEADDPANDEQLADFDKWRSEGRDELDRRVQAHLRQHRSEMQDIAILTGNKNAKDVVEFTVPLEDVPVFQEVEHPRDLEGRFTNKPWMFALPPPTLTDMDGDRDKWDAALRTWLSQTFPDPTHVRDGEERVWDTRFELEGIDTDLLYDVAKSLGRFAHDFPFVIDGEGVDFVGEDNGVGGMSAEPGVERRPALSHVRMVPAEPDKEMVFASYEVEGDGDLNLNSDWWATDGKRRNRLEETLAATESVGWFAKGTGTPEGIINHELGHALTAYIGAHHQDLWQWLEDERWFGSVSKYARQNFLEFFAETFSSILANDDPGSWNYEQRMVGHVLGEVQSRESEKM